MQTRTFSLNKLKPLLSTVLGLRMVEFSTFKIGILTKNQNKHLGKIFKLRNYQKKSFTGQFFGHFQVLMFKMEL